MSEIQRQNQEGESNFAELQKELSLKQYEIFVDSLEKKPLEDVHELLAHASQNHPAFKTSLQRFQEQQSQTLKLNFQQLSNTQPTPKIQKSPELPSQDLQKLLEVGKKELQNIENEQKILHKKKLQVELIQEVASTYKEYLQSIASSLSFKIISSKDERYQTQIDTMTQKIQEISFLVKYLDVTKNHEELKNLNINTILNILFVSEEKISQSGIMHHPTGSLWNEKISIQAVNAGYEDIKKLLQTPDLTPEKVQDIKLQIFEKLRFFDVSGVDDNNIIYDTSEPISSRVRGDVMQNTELRKTAGIENVFLFLENVSAEEKQKLYESLLDNRETFYQYMNTLGVVHEFDFKNEKEKQDFFKEIFKELRTQVNQFKDEDIQNSLQIELTKQYDYLLKNVPAEQRGKYEQEKNNAFNNLELLTKVAKQEIIFEGFQRLFVNQILEKNASQVEMLSQTDKALKLYADIEGIGGKMSDKTFNSISSTTTLIIEQVALMFISGGIGNLALKGATSGITKLAPAVENAHKSVKFLSGITVESTAFYGAYTAMNGIVNQESYEKIAESYNGYDYLRTIAFLGVLRGIPLENFKKNLTINNTTLNETKNIVLDTASVLGTDIVIRTTIGELRGKEGIPRDELGEITLQKSREFLLEEIAFILPLVIGLRQSDKTIGAILEQKPAPKVEVLSQKDRLILKIEGVSKDIIILKKDIRNLEQSRNILRNKDKSTTEINATLQDKKAEVKDLKIQQQQLTTQLQNLQELPTPVIQNPQTAQNLTIKETHSARSNVNMNTGSKNIQEFFRGRNIEDVMKGFDFVGNKMTKDFETLLTKGGNKAEAQELIKSSIEKRVNELTQSGVKIDDIGRQYIKRFEEARIAEFNKLLEIKEKGGLIPRELEMTISGMKPWRLELNNVKMMNEFFGEFAKKIAENRKQQNMKLKNN